MKYKKKTTNEKPVSLDPQKFKVVLEGLLKVKPKEKPKKKSESKKRAAKKPLSSFVKSPLDSLLEFEYLQMSHDLNQVNLYHVTQCS